MINQENLNHDSGILSMSIKVCCRLDRSEPAASLTAQGNGAWCDRVTPKMKAGDRTGEALSLVEGDVESGDRDGWPRSLTSSTAILAT